MRKFLFSLVYFGLFMGMFFVLTQFTLSDPKDKPAGSHYNLNIIAVPENNRPDDSNDSSRHTIFAPLDEVQGDVDCRIYLAMGNKFDVVDGFCLDGDARFTLPDPDPDDDGTVEYQVWIALAGKPG